MHIDHKTNTSLIQYESSKGSLHQSTALHCTLPIFSSLSLTSNFSSSKQTDTLTPIMSPDFRFRQPCSYPGGGLYERFDHVRLVLQLHDELIYEIREKDLPAVRTRCDAMWCDVMRCDLSASIVTTVQYTHSLTHKSLLFYILICWLFLTGVSFFHFLILQNVI